jgi:aryl-alcohol dehydrogenase (NADP+)
MGGPRTLEQWEDYYGALSVAIDADDEQFVDKLVSPGHPSTPGYTDPQFPVTGRPA